MLAVGSAGCRPSLHRASHAVRGAAAAPLCRRLVSRPTPCMASAQSGLDVTTGGGAAEKPVLLLDVMDTLVVDPFFEHMPAFFGMSFAELMAAKHPHTWLEFESGRISEDEMFAAFFADGRECDGPGLRAMMASHYRYIDGIEPLLGRLKAAGYEMHTLSNYPIWFRLIEEKLQLSRYVDWTYISCEGAMEGHRKPAPAAYAAVLEHLKVPAGRCIFVDDRKNNVEGAIVAGMDGILFTGAAGLEEELKARGLQF